MELNLDHRIVNSLKIAVSVLALSLSSPGHATPMPPGWTCSGYCGSSGPDGVVTAPPGGSSYNWVSTYSSGILSNNLGLGNETNGSVARSPVFSANAGDTLEFYFNYVTSDGADYTDYAWARLLDSAMSEVALLFTARTTPGGNTVPGFGMPPIDATINPSNVTVASVLPVWSPLGSDSGRCYAKGCGYTDWVQAIYDIPDTGDYILELGVTNWKDSFYDSGLAFAGTRIAGNPIAPIPEPGILALMSVGFIGMAAARQRSKP